jgi:hypothetical protein
MDAEYLVFPRALHHMGSEGASQGLVKIGPEHFERLTGKRLKAHRHDLDLSRSIISSLLGSRLAPGDSVV